MAALDYVHGYHPEESARLHDQASTLEELLHGDTAYPAGSSVLEVGCGVGAQTRILATRSPHASFTAIDVSPPSVEATRASVAALGLANVTVQLASVLALPFPEASFDHAFICFVLEHLREPERALRAAARAVRPGGTLTVIEGDHGSAFFHPPSAKAARTIDCLVQAQARAGGDANIGRRLYPLLTSAGLADVAVSPRFVYADDSRPAWVDGFTRKTFIAMVEGARPHALELGLIAAHEWDEGLADLRRTSEPGGTFCYTFFKGTGTRR